MSKGACSVSFIIERVKNLEKTEALQSLSVFSNDARTRQKARGRSQSTCLSGDSFNLKELICR